MEQRRSTRIPVDTRLMVAVPGFGLAPVRACNVSAGGACVQIARPALAAGALVQLVYVVRNDASVMHRHVRAVVMRVSADSCGLMFTNVGPATFDMVNEMKRTGCRPPTVPRRERWQIAGIDVLRPPCRPQDRGQRVRENPDNTSGKPQYLNAYDPRIRMVPRLLRLITESASGALDRDFRSKPNMEGSS